MKNKLLRQLRTLHRWTGLTAGLVLVIVAVSGAGMALRGRLEPVLSAGLMRTAPCAAPLPLDALVASARTVAPNAGPLLALRLSAALDATVHIRFGDDRWIYVAPCSGAVLGSEHRYKGLFGTLDALHRFKYLPNSELIAGCMAATLALVLLAGGLMLWRPSRRAAKHALTLHPHLSPRAFSISLHKTAALYAGPILLFSALSGVVQAFDWPKQAVLAATGGASIPAAPATLPARTFPKPSLEDVWQTAHRYIPSIGQALIMMPKRPSDPIRMELVASDAPHAAAHSDLDISPASGAVLRYLPYDQAGPGKRFLMYLFALHTAQLGGFGVQLLLILGALSVPVLAFAGWRSYLLGRTVRSGSV